MLVIDIIDDAEISDPANCEDISGALEVSRKVECYLNLGIKLADPEICEKIETYGRPSYEKGKNYCIAVASRDVSKCELLVDFWKDRCKALLLKDSFYCDMKEGKPSNGCLIAMEFDGPYID